MFFRTKRHLALAALTLALTLGAASSASAAWQICSATWGDYFDLNTNDFLYGGIGSIGLGGKGTVDYANDTLSFDAYQTSSYLGTATADANGNVTTSGSITAFEPLALGTDCNDPNTFVRAWLKIQVAGYSFYIFAY